MENSKDKKISPELPEKELDIKRFGHTLTLSMIYKW